MNEHHKKERKDNAIERVVDARKCIDGMKNLVNCLVPQVYGQNERPIKCEIPSFNTVDSARIGLSVIYSHIAYFHDVIKNLLEPPPETYNLKNRTVKMLLQAVNDSIPEPISLSDKLALQTEFEHILQNTLQDRIDELKRHIDGMCPCCGGMGRVPYGGGIPDGEDYDLCPVCHWEKIADVLKGNIKRIDIKA